MRLPAVALMLAATAWLSPATAAAEGSTRRALLIGIDRYSERPLGGAGRVRTGRGAAVIALDAQSLLRHNRSHAFDA